MTKIYVIDTNALIYYYGCLFDQEPRLSKKAMSIISIALDSKANQVRLSIPSIVFVEIFRKWLRKPEFARRFYYDVFVRCRESPNIEIRPIEREILENLALIRGSLSNHEIHDKIILASAMTLNCPLITLDGAIANFVDETGVIPTTIS